VQQLINAGSVPFAAVSSGYLPLVQLVRNCLVRDEARRPNFTNCRSHGLGYAARLAPCVPRPGDEVSSRSCSTGPSWPNFDVWLSVKNVSWRYMIAQQDGRFGSPWPATLPCPQSSPEPPQWSRPRPCLTRLCLRWKGQSVPTWEMHERLVGIQPSSLDGIPGYRTPNAIGR
jgi:hypothetical protein